MRSKNLSLTELVTNFLKILKDSWDSLILSIFIIFSLTGAVFLIGVFAYYLPIYLGAVTYDLNIFPFKQIWNLIFSLLFFLIGVFAQILIIHTLLKPEAHFKARLKAVKPIFWSFLCLTIINYLLLLIASSPTQIGIIFLAFEESALGFISIIVGLLLALILVSFIMFSSFILVEKKQKCLAALKKSFQITQKNFFNIVFHLIVLILIIIILNSLSVVLFFVPTIGLILHSLILVAFIMFAFIYMFAMYQTFKNVA